ncbi:peptidoglycan D,D-transpeptidase FtsI family protein [Dethiobacter alkaliphilus]|uniref:peptidoglycan D,D-transpeptidase FtsI family protein n=1 Tax=Dethiobacter alkaliphilus TaxID=427926 RepID=UPI00222609A7|nr:penicillin-binding transpeptidase domain-containing protein [Dethiobacter alkaliphilus]MCW3490406.1 penicillin-binding transpeptidase domain-containing protein [Dethiobacter alkaliphilus]
MSKRIERQKRIVILTLLFFLPVFALLGRLFQLQILEGPQYARIAVNQRSLRYDYKPTGRGQILDREGVSLLDSQWKPVTVFFEPILDGETREILSRHAETRPDQSVFAFGPESTINRELGDMPREGVISALEQVRYGYNSLAPHVTGFVQQATNNMSGLERAFNDELSAGRPFSVAAIVDARGNLVEGLGYRDWRGDDAGRPYSIITTIDSHIQATVEQVLGDADLSGAVVVMEPQSGDILAMASYPDFKPRSLYTGLEVQYDRENHLNKAIRPYEPGSVFKTVLTAAALEENMASETYYCTGAIELSDDTSIPCYENQAHGEVDLRQALTVSCNVYFVWLGQKLGRETLQETAERFKLGSVTGIPLGEHAGQIPSPAQMPFLGDLGNASIGQGKVQATPLQITRMMATIINNGRDVYPRLVSELIDSQGNTVREFRVYTGTQVIHPAVSRSLRSMLTDVVQSGTGSRIYNPDYLIAGKTGTAQATIEGKSIEHSWFAGYAEPDGQPLVITVFLHGKDNPLEPEPGRDATPATQIFRRITDNLH